MDDEAGGTVAEAPATVAAESGPDERPEAVLSQKERRIVELEGQMKRLAADMENLRRRTREEQDERSKLAAKAMLEEFLPILDNFERALEGGRKATDGAQVLAGVELIYRQLQDFLTRAGVAAMEAKGKLFDPNYYEAIAQAENLLVPDQTVLEEIQKGYFLHGKVLRHARVQVASNPQDIVTIEAQPANPDKEDNHG